MICPFFSHSQPHHLTSFNPSQGDSGGPLIQRGTDKSGKDDVLVGIVSWGKSNEALSSCLSGLLFLNCTYISLFSLLKDWAVRMTTFPEVSLLG